MKHVVANVQPECLNSVLEALGRELTTHRSDFEGRSEKSRGIQINVELADDVRLDIGVADHFVEPAVQAIRGAAKSAATDGIVVMPEEESAGALVQGEPELALASWV
jgi:nitrogen regulatory protein P-II 1